MGDVIIKPRPDQDMYVVWSTERGAPVAYGSRADLVKILGDVRAGPCPTCHGWVPLESATAARLDRTDANGTSDLTRAWCWGDDEFVYEQRGLLARRDLIKACELLTQKRDDEVWDLLKPFEDGMGVRHG